MCFLQTPYPSFQPPLLLVARIQPATPACYNPLTTLRAPPASSPPTVPSRRNGLLRAGRSRRPEVPFARSALIEDVFFLPPLPYLRFLPCTFTLPTSVENLTRTTKAKIALLVTGGRRLNEQLAARGEFLESL